MRNNRMWTLALSDTSFPSQSWAFDLGAAYLQDGGVSTPVQTLLVSLSLDVGRDF